MIDENVPICPRCGLPMMGEFLEICLCEEEDEPLRYALPNVNGGEKPSVYKGVLKENEAP